MNLKLFNTSTTNVFPATNTTNGGQLVTEFNLRAREAVATSESVKYMYGPSFVHSEDDFHLVPDVGGTLILQPGRAVVNGYYVESLSQLAVDMAVVNSLVVEEGGEPYSGEICVGLRVYFSTEEAMIGSFLPEDSANYYEGIQVIVLPKDKFVLPTSTIVVDNVEIDCGLPENRQYVTADLLLGTFMFIGGSISNVQDNYPKKCQMMPAVRIDNIDGLISDSYVKKSGLDPNKLYTFAGKGTDPETGDSTWCDSTDSLMVWDSVPQLTAENPNVLLPQAVFSFGTDESQMQLIIPHKQVDGSSNYYKPRIINVPKADFALGTPGTVTKEYTMNVKAIRNSINSFYQLTNGTQRAFVDELTDRKNLPIMNAQWNVGDYILVAKDYTLSNSINDTMNITPPSTLYVVLPGVVTSIAELGTLTQPTGVCLDTDTITSSGSEGEGGRVDTTSNGRWDIDSGKYRGVVNDDYFMLSVYNGSVFMKNLFYPVLTTNGLRSYSEPIQLTGQYPFASENLTGGFLNAPESYKDAGYVYLDDFGHLRLRDYGLLRSGTLAYQLGQDLIIEGGLTLTEIQAQLDEYVNQRVAFPNATQLANIIADDLKPDVITITMTLPDDTDESGTQLLNISGIDSRFNTAVVFEIYGKATSNTQINFSDCARVKINLHSGTPLINLERSCLYYDANMLNKLNYIDGMTLWYERFSSTDPVLSIEGMTVYSVAESTSYGNIENYTIASSEYWTNSAPNDNHFDIALQSLTFSNDGSIIKCGVAVRNNSTSNITPGRFIFQDTFILPNNTHLPYPMKGLTKPVNVTGRFVSAYPITGPTGYMVQETDFSLKTQAYNSDMSVASDGEVAFLVNTYAAEMTTNPNISVWNPQTFHSFDGSISL